MNAGQITGAVGIVLGLAAECAPVTVIGVPCGPAAYAAAAHAICRPSALPWVLIGVVLLLGGTITAAAATPKGPPPLPTDRVPLIEAVGWIVCVLVAVGLLLGLLAYLGRST